MKIPFLIFLISGFATMQLEPVATRSVALAGKFVRARMKARTPGATALRAGDAKIDCLKEELADVQLDLMKVLETDRSVTERLESREAGLKYALRAAQVRRDEIAQCQRAAAKALPAAIGTAVRRAVAATGMRRS